MRGWLGAAVLLAVLGGGAGYAVAAHEEASPDALGTPAPVPAENPAVPTVAPPSVAVDPAEPALGTDLTYHRVRLPTGAAAPLRLDVPVDWVRDPPPPQRATTFTWAGPDRVRNTYNLRVQVVAGSNIAPVVYLQSRIFALTIAEEVSDLDVEVREGSESTATLVASYLDGGSYRRVTMQRWRVLDDTSTYATVAVTGREVDRPGLEALLDRVSESLLPQ